MDDIPLLISNPSACDRVGYPVSVGIPLPRKLLHRADSLRLQDEANHDLPLVVTPTGYWSDGSIRWLKLDTQVDILSNQQSQLLLQLAKGGVPCSVSEQPGLLVDSQDSRLIIDTGAARFSICGTNGEGKIIDSILVEGLEQLDGSGICLTLESSTGDALRCEIFTVSLDEHDENHLNRTAMVQGAFLSANGNDRVEFSISLSFYAGKAFFKTQLCLLNPKAARHEKGVWDLGDPNSFLFKSLSVNLTLNPEQDTLLPVLQVEPFADWMDAKQGEIGIYQDSSGGEQWNCNNHMNAKGDVPVTFKGYQVYAGRDKVLAQGLRASPLLKIGGGNISVTIFIQNFWQNFPNALSAKNGKLQISLFPGEFSDVYELQGGEQKTQSFYLDFCAKSENLADFDNPVIARLPAHTYVESGVFFDLGSVGEATDIQQLISGGLSGDNSFFAKREFIDEYGWRNFGDIYADHEQLEYKGKDLLISHYNNQYDPLYGFILQYLKTADLRWMSLIEPLARHIVDIDIYHTEQDRDEYNGGLFWHTDHYLNAFTCTHRTFSARHAEDFLYGEIGGGPGTEHCYTTGLASLFFMSGDHTYKEAALGLTKWIDRSFNGSGTVLERLFKFKTRDIPLLKRLLKGEKIQRYRYPFTRGTGNYLTALVDAYSLTGDEQYLQKADEVIRHSVHPEEDISLRCLDDIESSWSYLVFLQALGKYLDVKIKNALLDESVAYTRACLLLYADWVAKHERPFLEQAEQLEFPNETWTAQDLRKANILKVAACYSKENRDNYLEKAAYFEEYVANRLKSEPNSAYSRILIILMQNDIAINQSVVDARSSLNLPEFICQPAPMETVTGVISDFLLDVVRALFRFSLKNEKKWLKFRL